MECAIVLQDLAAIAGDCRPGRRNTPREAQRKKKDGSNYDEASLESEIRDKQPPNGHRRHEWNLKKKNDAHVMRGFAGQKYE